MNSSPAEATLGFEDQRADPPAPRLLLVLAAIALGEALQVTNAWYHPRAMALATLAFALALAAAVWQRWPGPRVADGVLQAVIAAGLALQFQRLLTAAPGVYQRFSGELYPDQFRTGVLAAAVLSFLALLGEGRVRRAAFWLLLAAHFALGVWMIKSSPNPWIDVFLMHQGGIPAFLHGTNPYTMDFPYIYGGADTNIPHIAAHGRTLTGFPYPPLSLLLSIPGYLLGGDYRYGLLASMTLFGAALARFGGNKLGAGLAALYLFTPRTYFVLEQGWTEPFVLLLFAALVWSAQRRPALLSWMFGLLLFVKQYTPLVAPAALLLKRAAGTWRAFTLQALKALALGVALMAPFLIASPRALYESTLGVQFYLPPRPRDLSFTAALPDLLALPWGPTALTAAGSACVLLTYLMVRRTALGFTLALAMTFFCFFAFRIAFCNYYYLVIGLLLLAAAVANTSTEPRTST